MASKKALAAARKKKGGHVGPHGSYPVVDGPSARNAWNLAGHAANPGKIRAAVKRKAAALGVTSSLPKTARKKSAGKKY
jgi:hypothetical protein